MRWRYLPLLILLSCRGDGVVSVVAAYDGTPLRLSLKTVREEVRGGTVVRIEGEKVTYDSLPSIGLEEVCVEDIAPYPGVRLALRTMAEREGWMPNEYVNRYLSRIPDSLRTLHDYATLFRLYLKRGNVREAGAILDSMRRLTSPLSLAVDLLTWGERPDTLASLLGPLYPYEVEYYKATGNYDALKSLLYQAFRRDPALPGLYLYDFAWASLYSGDTSLFLEAMGYAWAVYGDTSALSTLREFGASVKVKYPEVPDITLRTLRGDTLSLRSLRGKVVLIVFWNSTCSACTEQIPALSSLSGRLEGRPFLMIAVSKEPSGRLKDFNVLYPVVPGGAHVFDAFSIFGVPSYVLVSPAGRVVRRWIGKRVDVHDLERAIRSLLPGGGP